MNETNRSFEATLTSAKIVSPLVGTTGVCTLVVPKLRKYAVLLKIFEILGAEGGTRTPTSYLTRPSNVRVCQFRHFGMK